MFLEFFESLCWITGCIGFANSLEFKEKKTPTTTAGSRRIVTLQYSFVEHNFDLILDIEWNATENSNAF